MTFLRAALLALLFIAAPAVAQPSSAQAGVDSLLAADRAFAVAAARSANALEGLEPMFDGEVVMPAPGAVHAIGREAVLAAFRTNPAFAEGRVEWTPIRGGISADGTHGFTFGYLTLSAGDPARRSRKYLAYWIRRPEGWRVVAYRQTVRPAGEVSLDPLPPSLPTFTAAPANDPDAIAAHQRSLAAAERAFSDRAQQVGLKRAFGEFGREDAMNMSQGPAFRIGLAAITADFPEAPASPLNWGTDRSFVASSGDLGVSIGTIYPNGPVPEGQPPSFPFFTVWRRDSPDAPWRYIAE